MKNWTLKVRNFGKIISADVDIGPFTLFVGDNNSGKSYLMTLIYGLLNVDFSQFKIDRDTPVYATCDGIIKDKIEEGYGIYHFQQNEFQQFNELLNEVLELNKEKFIRSLFNTTIPIGKISVELEYDSQFILVYRLHGIGLANERNALFCGIEYEEQFKYLNGVWVNDDFTSSLDTIMLYVLSSMLQTVCGSLINNKTIYLPTSRTGFMLTFKSLIDRSLTEHFNLGESTIKTLLTRPCIDFIKTINELSVKNEIGDYADLLSFIENQIIDGKVVLNDLPSPDIGYRPNGQDGELPLFVTSGVVTELTPLSLILRYGRFSGIMMEEPEMCLHPKLQWQIARVLIKLVNKGIPVLIATHSDTILQHVNNMIKLFNSDNRQELLTKYNYAADDVLQSSKLQVYQFETKDHGSHVRKLECDSDGVTVPSFNNMLIDMLRESREFTKE